MFSIEVTAYQNFSIRIKNRVERYKSKFGLRSDINRSLSYIHSRVNFNQEHFTVSYIYVRESMKF